MFCTNCGAASPAGTTSCPRCGTASVPPTQGFLGDLVKATSQAVRSVQAAFAPSLREQLLDFLLDDLTSQGLSDWLKELGQDPRGSPDEKKHRIRQHSPFLTAPAPKMIHEAMAELKETAPDYVRTLCRRWGLPDEGSKFALMRRLHRYIATREGLLPPWTRGAQPSVRDVYSLVGWYPIYQNKSYERDLYDDFEAEMIDVFGENLVHHQVSVAHGTTLKIDFHLGSPVHGGVGVEFKMPANNSDIQKAIGQLGQYQMRYGASLIVVVFPNLIENKHLLPFTHELTRMNVWHVVKRSFWDETG